MRVAIISSHAHGFDGWGRYTVELIRAVQPLGVEPVLITADDQLDESLKGIEHHAIMPPLFTRRFETPRSLLHAPKLRRVLADVDIAHGTVELYLPLLAASVGSTPLVMAAHGTWAIRPLESRTQRPFFRSALRRVDALIVLSHFTRDWMARLASLPPTHVLTGGVHPAPFEADTGVKLPDWTTDKQIALTVGAVKPRKGQQIALDAVRRLTEQFPDLHYVIIGALDNAPGYVAGLRQQITAWGLTERVHLLGAVPFAELVAWYQRADVFMMLSSNQGSSFEGLGLVYLEAGAAGTPSIGTTNCGAEEAIRDGETGLLVPQNDPQAAADALATLLEDSDRLAAMGAAARDYAHSLTWARLGEQVMDVYRDLVTGHSA